MVGQGGLQDGQPLLAAVPETTPAPGPPQGDAPTIPMEGGDKSDGEGEEGGGVDGAAGGGAAGAGAAPAPRSASSSPVSPSKEPVVQTLSGQNPEAAAWHAHQQRRLLMKERKKNKVGQGNFLSNVGEVDSDVSFRFTFTVVAPEAVQLIEAVCNSAIALKIGGGGPLSKRFGKDAMYRCLCEVSGPAQTPAPSKAASTTQPNMPQTKSAKSMAKLAFHARGFEDDPPPCYTRQDALNNAIVYALDIAATNKDGEPTFPEQLANYHKALSRLRASTKSKLRPVKALLLYSSTSDGAQPKSGLESWALQLADFEQETGDTWKFGPVPLQDEDALHHIFAEMTSTRLAHTQNEDQQEDMDGEEEPPTFTPSAGDYRPNRRRDGRHSSNSSVSEQERPPCFDAEMSGSECSDSALELHARTFGLDVEDLKHAAKDMEDDEPEEQRVKETE